MSNNWVFTGKNQSPSFTTQIDVSTGPSVSSDDTTVPASDIGQLLRQMVAGQNHLIAIQSRQNELLEEVVDQLSSAARQRAVELAKWKQANPRLARSCKAAADKLGQIQTDFIESLSDEIEDNFELLHDGEFVLNEFVDRFGPRFVHLNTILQVLTQLGNAPDAVLSKKVEKD